jgi:HAD superfamily hydrolase (TIGR01484 family)
MNNNISKYDLIIFDLDGTLTPSKSALGADMGEALTKLLEKKKVAVISGCNFEQFKDQFLKILPVDANIYKNLIILPTSGSGMYLWNDGWKLEYSDNLSPNEKMKIRMALDLALKELPFLKPETTYGDQIEDRGSQITFSALGQKAPLAAKAAWDPDRSKREALAKSLLAKLPEFDVTIGGMTSDDVTHHGVNKAYGIRKIEGYLKLGMDKILFVGDALMPGGNDYPAKSTGVDCKQVSGPEETLKLINSWLA